MTMEHRILSTIPLRTGLALLILVALLAGSLSPMAWAQEGKKGLAKSGRGKASQPEGGGATSSKKGSASAEAPDVTLSKVIDPARYVLGPGDHLTVTLWGEYSSVESVTISADGKISLDTIGELKLVGLTLDQARALLKAAMVKYYRNVEGGISLASLRMFKVWVLGAVNAPGSYSATRDTRVSELISLAGGVLPGGSRRSIEVRKDGKARAVADLNAFLRRGDEGANPFLQDSDTIFVPPLTGPLIRVFDLAAGAPGENEAKGVPSLPAAPMEYELDDHQRFSDLVFELGGLNPSWDPDSAYVVRSLPGKEGVTKIKIDLEQLLIHHNVASDVVLQNGDQVFLGAQLRSPFLNGKGELIGIEKPYDRQQAK